MDTGDSLSIVFETIEISKRKMEISYETRGMYKEGINFWRKICALTHTDTAKGDRRSAFLSETSTP